MTYNRRGANFGKEKPLLDTQSIISDLETERDRLEQAISALKGDGRGVSRRPSSGMGRRRRLSAAASEADQ